MATNGAWSQLSPRGVANGSGAAAESRQWLMHARSPLYLTNAPPRNRYLLSGPSHAYCVDVVRMCRVGLPGAGKDAHGVSGFLQRESMQSGRVAWTRVSRQLVA